MSLWRIVNNLMEIAWDVEIHRKCQIVSVVQWGQNMLGVSSYRESSNAFFVLETFGTSHSSSWCLVNHWLEIA